MPVTNALTAEAATRPAPPPSHALTLLGVFTSPEEARALIHTESGDAVMLTAGTEQAGITLMETGDGWALIQQNGRFHRLVIA